MDILLTQVLGLVFALACLSIFGAVLIVLMNTVRVPSWMWWVPYWTPYKMPADHHSPENFPTGVQPLRLKFFYASGLGGCVSTLTALDEKSEVPIYCENNGRPRDAAIFYMANLVAKHWRRPVEIFDKFGSPWKPWVPEN